MYKVNEKVTDMGNWIILDEQERVRAVIYSTELTREPIALAEAQAQAVCRLFNEAERIYKATNRLLDDVMEAKPNINNLCGVELAEKINFQFPNDQTGHTGEGVQSGSPFGADCIVNADLCPCGQPAGKDDELCPSCRTAEIERTHTEQEVDRQADLRRGIHE